MKTKLKKTLYYIGVAPVFLLALVLGVVAIAGDYAADSIDWLSYKASNARRWAGW